MAYTSTNFKSKKALKEAITGGKKVSVYQLTPFGSEDITDGTAYLEGPHYPEPHKWYAVATVKDGYITKVK